MTGCTNPNAKNYDPSATEDDGSCIYLVEIDGHCKEFEDVKNQDQLVDTSFTLSYSIPEKNWVFFHDYFPDYYFHTRRFLYNLKFGKSIYQHNKGSRGVYHDTIKPFFIDVLFANQESVILSSVSWLTEVRESGNNEADENSASLYFETITAITIWNNNQCTGRIVLDKDNLPLLNSNNRNAEQLWSFNDFRDIARTDTQFLDNIFKNYAILPQSINTELPWYEKRLMNNRYFIVRLEFDNFNDRQITLHDVEANISVSTR